MADQNDTHVGSFAQSGGLDQHRRVKITDATTRTVAYAGAGDRSIGTTRNQVHGTEGVAVQFSNKVGTRKMVAAGPIAALARIYGAANGKVDDTPNGNYEGIAIDAAAADGDVIETILLPEDAAVQALAGGRVLITGEVTLDGANPTSIPTGLAGVESAVVTLKRTTTPGVDPHHLSVDYSGSSGTVNVYAWKPTSTGDGTLIASTNNTAVVAYQIVALLVAAA